MAAVVAAATARAAAVAGAMAAVAAAAVSPVASAATSVAAAVALHWHQPQLSAAPRMPGGPPLSSSSPRPSLGGAAARRGRR
jgi:hypothetical protein